MLLCSYACKGLKPVTVMSGTLLDGPFLHLVGNHICNLHGKLLALFNGFLQLFVNLLRQTVLHDGIIEYITSE